jgi:hypothetical protein
MDGLVSGEWVFFKFSSRRTLLTSAGEDAPSAKKGEVFIASVLACLCARRANDGASVGEDRSQLRLAQGEIAGALSDRRAIEKEIDVTRRSIGSSFLQACVDLTHARIVETLAELR